MEQQIKSRPYQPKLACEKCVFNRGDHAPWCPGGRWIYAGGSDNGMRMDYLDKQRWGWTPEQETATVPLTSTE